MSESSDAVRAYWKAAETQDLDGGMAAVADDMVLEDVATEQVARGKDEFRKMGEEWYGATDYSLKVEKLIISGDTFAAEWSVKGRMVKAYGPWAGNGQEFRMRGASVGQVRDGLVVRCSDYWNKSELEGYLEAGQ